MKKYACLYVLFTLFFSGCAKDQLDAPCNHKAQFCSVKTKINKW